MKSALWIWKIASWESLTLVGDENWPRRYSARSILLSLMLLLLKFTSGRNFSFIDFLVFQFAFFLFTDRQNNFWIAQRFPRLFRLDRFWTRKFRLDSSRIITVGSDRTCFSFCRMSISLKFVSSRRRKWFHRNSVERSFHLAQKNKTHEIWFFFRVLKVEWKRIEWFRLGRVTNSSIATNYHRKQCFNGKVHHENFPRNFSKVSNKTNPNRKESSTKNIDRATVKLYFVANWRENRCTKDSLFAEADWTKILRKLPANRCF